VASMRLRRRKPALELACANCPDKEPFMTPGGRGIVSATQEKGWKEPCTALFEMPAIVTMDDV
jgi:hypothetical protein